MYFGSFDFLWLNKALASGPISGDSISKDIFAFVFHFDLKAVSLKGEGVFAFTAFCPLPPKKYSNFWAVCFGAPKL